MKPTDRDMSAVLAGLGLCELIRDVGARQTRWALAATGILAFALAWWLHETRRSRRQQWQGSCTCGWKTRIYDDQRDADSAARAHIALGDHRQTTDNP